MKKINFIIFICLFSSCNIDNTQSSYWKSNIDNVLSFKKSKFYYKKYPLYNIKLVENSTKIYSDLANYNYSQFHYQDSTIFIHDCALKYCDTLICFKRNKNNAENCFLIQSFWSEKYSETIYRIRLNHESNIEDNIILLGLKCGIIGIYVQNNQNLDKPIIKDINGEIFTN